MIDKQEIQTLSPSVKEYFALDNAARSWWDVDGHSRYDKQLEIVSHQIEAKGKVVLDVATGRGRFAIQYIRSGAEEVIATDISKGMLAIAMESARLAGVAARIEFLQGDIEGHLFEEESFHIINCMELYVHLPNPQSVTNLFFRYLSAGGFLVANIDIPLTNKWYFHWINEPLRSVSRHLFPWHIARYIYFKLLPSVARNVLHKAFGWPIKPRAPLCRQVRRPIMRLPTTEETIEALKTNPHLRLSRAEDAINRMELETFIEIIRHAGFEVEKVIREGKWFQLPYGYIVIARKPSIQ